MYFAVFAVALFVATCSDKHMDKWLTIVLKGAFATIVIATSWLGVVYFLTTF